MQVKLHNEKKKSVQVSTIQNGIIFWIERVTIVLLEVTEVHNYTDFDETRTTRLTLSYVQTWTG